MASIAPSVMHGIGVKGFAPPPPPAFFRLCSVLDLVVVCCRHDPAVETVAGCAKERATLSREARDGMRRPMEPTGARANLSHDLLDAPHRLVFHQPHHHQQAQRRAHVTPHAVANSPSFEGETSRLLPIAIQRCCSVNGTESVRIGQDGSRNRLLIPKRTEQQSFVQNVGAKTMLAGAQDVLLQCQGNVVLLLHASVFDAALEDVMAKRVETKRHCIIKDSGDQPRCRTL